MKTAIHPTIHADAKTICSCGAVHKIPGTTEELHVEVCSECHPFYTGNIKVVDTAGRIDKFKARQEAAAKMQKK